MTTDLYTSLFLSYGLPAPVQEYRFHPKRKWRIDYAWPDALLAVEIEGGVFSCGRHVRGIGYLNDKEWAIEC